MPSQTLIITGASRGIGAATARAAAELGANVVICARSEADLAVVAGQITGAGGQVLPVAADVGSHDDCRRLIDAAVERFGGLDAVVSNAATLDPVAPIVTVISFEPGTVDTAMHTFIRAAGEPAMLPADHAMFVSFHEQGLLRAPEVPGRALAHVALRAPRDWTGTLVAWDDARVQSLMTG